MKGGSVQNCVFIGVTQTIKGPGGLFDDSGEQLTVNFGGYTITPNEQYDQLRDEVDRLREAVLWALGERGGFPIIEGPPYYIWRKELRRRALEGGDD